MSVNSAFHREVLHGLRYSNEFSTLQKFVLRLAHPRAVFVQMAGLIWAVYYLWMYNWPMAIGVALASTFLSYLTVLDADYEKISTTTLGRIGLLHLHPMNLLIRTVGAVAFVYGVWNRHLEFSLAGVSIVLLGHTSGWSAVDDRLSTEL